MVPISEADTFTRCNGREVKLVMLYGLWGLGVATNFSI